MSAGYQDLYLEKGTTFTETLTLNDTYGNPYNLNGFQVASQARYSYYAANSTITFTAQITNANNGVITLSANAATTANIVTPPTTLLYDVILKDTSNNITRVLEGRVFVDPSITPKF
jgi:hypothetical protein